MRNNTKTNRGTTNLKPWIRVNLASHLLGVTRPTLNYHVNKGRVRRRIIDNRQFVSTADLVLLLSMRKKRRLERPDGEVNKMGAEN